MLKYKTKAMLNRFTVMAVLLLEACTTYNCDEILINRVYKIEGDIVIDTILIDESIHSYVAISDKGERLLFSEGHFLIKPMIGDSLHKKVGEAKYSLFRHDSVYVQQWDCSAEKAIILDKYSTNKSLKYIK